MRPKLAKKTKNALKNSGLAGGALFSCLAGGASAALEVTLALGFTGLGVLSFLVAGFGVIAREDIKRFQRLSVRNASSDDLDRFHARLSEFTSAVMPLSERHAISRKNPDCFRVIEDIRDNGEWRQSIDILAIYPLGQAAMEAVLTGQKRGADIRASEISKTFGRAVGLYVSFAEGRTFTTRGLIVKEIELAIGKVKKRPLAIATIPTTSLALATVTNRGFITLQGEAPVLNELCVLNHQ